MSERSTENGNGAPEDKSRASKAIDRKLLQKLLQFAGRPNVAIRLWDGWTPPSPTSPEVEMLIGSRAALYKLMLDPEFMFGELYTEGQITVRGDLCRLMEEVYKGLARVGGTRGLLQRSLERIVAPQAKADSPTKAKRNARAHYDLGNAFYALWLDQAYMQYTCAYYPGPATLEQAQRAKLELVCRKLNLQPGETVVEAGGGWGGLSRYMAEHHGVTVVSYNVSQEQVAYARQQAQLAGLADRITYVEDDYRNIDGTYDVFVSVGMLEHVGVENLGVLGQTIDGCLTQGGRGLIHSIGQISPRPLNKWIEANIFPGAHPPSLAEMTQIFEPFQMVVNDVENLRSHYAQTLQHWLQRFDEQEETVRAMFDDAFVRMWRLYLAGSAAAFTAGNLQLFQALFSRPGCTHLPATRDHIYSSKLVADA